MPRSNQKIIERTNEYLSIRPDVKSKQESIAFFPETCGMFDSTYSDNSNRRPFVRQPSKLGMDDSDYVRLIVEHNIVRKKCPKVRSINAMFNSIELNQKQSLTKSKRIVELTIIEHPTCFGFSLFKKLLKCFDQISLLDGSWIII